VEPDALTPLPPVLSLLDDTGAAVSPTEREWSVARLTAGVRRGEEQAVCVLHARYCQRLTRYALVITRGDEATAGEAVQSAFLKAVRSLRPLADEDALWAWLARAARTSVSDAGRRTRRYSAVLARVAEFFYPPDTAPPEDTDAVWHEALDQSLAELDPPARELITARYFRRTSLAEIAAADGTTERAIEGRLARVREKLRRSVLQHLSTRSHAS
jgi:RNA polymerase sigma-70 factor (ECF subfamily)